jgi:hypothetical protein
MNGNMNEFLIPTNLTEALNSRNEQQNQEPVNNVLINEENKQLNIDQDNMAHNDSSSEDFPLSSLQPDEQVYKI